MVRRENKLKSNFKKIKVLEQIPYLLGKQVTNDYIKEFEKADQAFQYQIVFDAGLRKQVPLNETNVVYPSAGE